MVLGPVCGENDYLVICLHSKIIILTFTDEEEYLLQVLRLGAAGYLVKNSSIDEIADAIRMAFTGEIALSPKMATRLVTELRKKSQDPVLSNREKEILALMVKGQSNNEIAKTLTVSPSTVKFHVSNILMKLSVTSRNKAVSLAVDNKLVKNDFPDLGS